LGRKIPDEFQRSKRSIIGEKEISLHLKKGFGKKEKGWAMGEETSGPFGVETFSKRGETQKKHKQNKPSDGPLGRTLGEAFRKKEKKFCEMHENGKDHRDR